MAWQGDASVRRLQVSFGDPVLDHQDVTATGTVTAVDEFDGERRATCDVQLVRNGVSVVTGVAVVALKNG